MSKIKLCNCINCGGDMQIGADFRAAYDVCCVKCGLVFGCDLEPSVMDLDAVGSILAGDIQKAGDIMSDIDIPDDDEVEVIEGENADMYDDNDEWHDIPEDDEPYSDFDDVSDFHDENISSFDISGMVLEESAPDFDTSDEMTFDSGLFYS